jgi:acyl-homoserine-lactone acylase
LIPNFYRVPFDATQPVAAPGGLKMGDAAVAGKVWESLALAVKNVRGAGFSLDATLGSVQHPLTTDVPIPFHGGDEFEGVLNNLGNRFGPGIGPKVLLIDYGTRYVQTVTFDARGPVAQALLVYGQLTDPASPHANDQLWLYLRKEWSVLPFHPEDVVRARVGEVLRLTWP